MARVKRNNQLTPDISGIENVYADFLRYKKSEVSEQTLHIYEDMGERFYIPQLSELTGGNLAECTADTLRIMTENYAESHKNGGTAFFLRHLKVFINWYWHQYNIPTANPAGNYRIRKTAIKPIPGITSEEIDKLLNAAKKHSNFPERDTAMIMILCDTGIRRRSLLELKMADVDLKNAEIITHEKDQRFHIHSFGSATTKAIRKYLDCLEDTKPTDPFWLKMDGSALTEYGAREVLRRLCTAAKIPTYHFHAFRRFYGLSLYNSTHDIYVVSRALGHKDVEVTKRYIAIDDRENAEALRTHSPMDKKYRQTGVRVQR